MSLQVMKEINTYVTYIYVSMYVYIYMVGAYGSVRKSPRVNETVHTQGPLTTITTRLCRLFLQHPLSRGGERESKRERGETCTSMVLVVAGRVL